ncbi:Bro-N domain-containing protein [Pseudomonas sp. H3(2019)]|uniref:BRO-N domain-containing protein n=1 Tax=Pseudomonas sp. H3(2019) TaxID=2598724 RepID=UPI001191E519|nr:Bro-N domain-containing protein [Pseudomonas sp. H3(2019)]TVT84081.1 Bro-N domain-containing protein [Pseudomonas sp. H3(2019)]
MIDDHFEAILFIRHHRHLHAIWLESQAWFCARDFGRLLGRYLDERAVRKLDPDQKRMLWLRRYGENHGSLMISESGAYALLIHHHFPENRNLRQWLTHEVVAVLRDAHQPVNMTLPNVSLLKWPGLSLSLLHWHNEPWVRLRDLPQVMSDPELSEYRRTPKRKRSWWQIATRFIQVN